jgi:S-adenosylmethionine hydrolase
MLAPRITLLTDFGTRDGYVAAMKGVIASHAPEAVVVDAGHGIPPQNIFAASWALCQYAWYYPEGTLHVVVVDPGVGTERKALLIEADGRYFVGPDNGVLSMAVDRATTRRLGVIRDDVHLSDSVSCTFHGRDIFAYAAALLASGNGSFEELSSPMDSIVTLPFPPVEQTSISIRGSVIHIDTFGNLITNIRDVDVQGLSSSPRTLDLSGGHSIPRWVRAYAEVGEGDLAALINSYGHVEIACNGASAAHFTRATLGSWVQVSV